MNLKTKADLASAFLCTYCLPIAVGSFRGALALTGSLALAEAWATDLAMNEQEGESGDFPTDSTSSMNGMIRATLVANSTSTESQTMFVPSAPLVSLGATGAARSTDYASPIDSAYFSRRDKV
jgi:hypothetical protein